MKTRSIALTVIVCFAAVALSFAENPNMGTWKLNEAKSKLAAGTIKNTTVVYSMATPHCAIAQLGSCTAT